MVQCLLPVLPHAWGCGLSPRRCLGCRGMHASVAHHKSEGAAREVQFKCAAQNAVQRYMRCVAIHIRRHLHITHKFKPRRQRGLTSPTTSRQAEIACLGALNLAPRRAGSEHAAGNPGCHLNKPAAQQLDSTMPGEARTLGCQMYLVVARGQHQPRAGNVCNGSIEGVLECRARE